MKKLPVILLALGAAGCAAPIDRTPYLNSLVGQPEAAVIRSLGVPTRTYDTDGHRFLAYREQRTSIYNSGPLFGFGGGYGYGGGFGGFGGGFGGLGGGFSDSEVVNRMCETTFEVVRGTVITWSLRGNACT